MSIALDAMLVTTPDVCGGRLRIEGTRITVQRIAVLYKQGLSAEEIVQAYSHLALGQVYAALAYYHANRSEIDAELAAVDAEYDKLREPTEEENRQWQVILAEVAATTPEYDSVDEAMRQTRGRV